MPEHQILVIEDEESILELVRYNLAREGFSVSTSNSGEEGLLKARDRKPDLIVLDLMLPGIDGLDVCKTLKRDSFMQRVPVLMISARGEEADIIKGLELGADDYVTKPFSPKVLIARVNAVLRRKRSELPTKDQILKIANVEINPGKFEVKVDNLSIVLTATEFNVLHFLARHPGWVFTRYQIVDSTKGEDYSVTDRAVDVQIVGLRKKLGEAGKLIETVRGVGYRFKE
jgi:two-component system, OmpR family, alkaline phosphatase synthesis response regulator PhoP